jgi:propionyl-CoA synthetase
MAAIWSRLKWTMDNLYGVKPGEVMGGSDVGWVVGHSYIVYGPLLHGATTICTRASRSARPMPARSGGSSPSTRPSRFFTAPTAFRAIRKEDPEASFSQI